MTGRCVTAILLMMLPACDPGDVVLLAPDESSGDVPPFSVRVVIDTSYTALAGSLGWSAGVAGAAVRVHRMDEPYDHQYWHLATADSTGLSVFPSLISGLYEVAVRRALGSDERAKTTDATRLTAGGRRINVSAGVESVVAVTPNRCGSLVFSEFSFARPSHWETAGVVYADADYIELYNNGDSTIYLDGKYLAGAWELNKDYPAWPCAQTEVVRNDPEGIWVARVFRFPGEGSDYPLLPGSETLIAKSAVDHRPVHAGLYDLRHADFEWGGSADNPDVPNLEFIGLRPPVYAWPGWGVPLLLTEPVNLEALPKYVDPHSGSPWVRIPAAAVLDASVATVDWTTQNYDAQRACLEDIHRSFERLAGPAAATSDFYDGLSAQRRIVYVLPDGRKVLQDTDTSMEDFVKAQRSPGWIPDSLGQR
jgi:hypothetical protein